MWRQAWNVFLALSDTMKAVNDFKIKQLKFMKEYSLICKSIYVLKVYSIHSTLRWDTNVKKISFGQNKRYKKCTLSSFRSSNSWQFYFQFAILILAEAQGSSLKNCVWAFDFRLRLILIKSLYSCSTKSGDSFTLKSHNYFQSKS